MPRKPLELLATLAVLLTSMSVPLSAQTTEADIKSRLKDKPLYLRGFWRDNDLHFDANGNLIGKSDPYPFTLAGFNSESVRFKKDKLILEGKRMGTEFEKDVAKRVPLSSLRIEIALPANSDYGPALNAIFADGLADLVPSLPAYWQTYGKCTLSGVPRPNPYGATSNCAAASDADGTAARVGGSVSPPRVVKMTDAQFNEFAKHLKYQGASLIGFILSKEGIPTQLQVIRAIGLGLDEQALAAVAQYRFSPAMRNGEPVRAQVNIEVAFHIY